MTVGGQTPNMEDIDKEQQSGIVESMDNEALKDEIEQEHCRLISLQSYHLLDGLPDPSFVRFVYKVDAFVEWR